MALEQAPPKRPGARALRVLVTGAAGYIGSHTILELLRAGHEVCGIDNYSNSAPEALARVKRLANADFLTATLDTRERRPMSLLMGKFKPDAVIHFAGLKAVGASSRTPVSYYDNNVSGSIALLAAMDSWGCRRIIFSSSATVYGAPKYLPMDEAHPTSPTNPYGHTKLMVERILEHWQAADRQSSAVCLRYFNPVGAHGSGDLGEDPSGIPNNLFPYVSQVAVGRRERVTIHGNDYDTPDGTGLRDYVHVVDLARAHVAALNYVGAKTGFDVFNVGTGVAHSVLDIINAFERASGRRIPYEVGPRREGDVAISLASVERARDLLGWEAKYGLDDMCASGWNWQSRNPNGYVRTLDGLRAAS